MTFISIFNITKKLNSLLKHDMNPFFRAIQYVMFVNAHSYASLFEPRKRENVLRFNKFSRVLVRCLSNV